MKDILDFLSHFRGMPLEQWMGLIALAAIGLSAFAIYVVHRAKDSK